MSAEGDRAGRDGIEETEIQSETPGHGKPIWGRLGVRTIVAALLVLTLLVALGLLLGPEYWRF